MSESKLSQALDEAQSIIEAAEKRAGELQEKAQSEYDQAKERGFQEGFEHGQRQAVDSAVRLLEDSGAIGDNLANQAARLALAIAGTVVGEHIRVAPDTIKEIARKALQESIIGETAIVVVHPEDKKTLEKASAELRRMAGGVGIGIEEDPELSRGSCVVRTDFGEVDARIETLLDTIRRRLGVQIDSNGKGK